MKFYSGFSLTNEEYLFNEYVHKSDFTLCGFSYGAIRAFKEALKRVESGKRLDRIQLFSPAFFETKEEKFKRVQLRSYRANKALYMQEFVKSCFAPYNTKVLEHKETALEELQELLEYVWDVEKLLFLESMGVKIEVYLGGKDAIIDVAGARDFFINFATLTYIKDANHFLQLS